MIAPSLLFAFAAAGAPGARSSDPCGLLGRNDVAAVLGGPVLAATPAGPMRDDLSSGRTTMCTYQGAGSSVVVSVTSFPTAGEAAKAASRERVAARLEGSGASVSEEGGIGDRAVFGTSSGGAHFVVQRGTIVVEVAIVGSGRSNPAGAKGRLRGLLAAALGGS